MGCEKLAKKDKEAMNLYRSSVTLQGIGPGSQSWRSSSRKRLKK